jgi:hypothetical protein
MTTPPSPCSGSVFVVDGTVNSRQAYDLAQEDFNTIKEFILSIIRDINHDQFRVGVMQYTGKDSVKMEIDFMSPVKFKEITMMQQRGNKRYTGDALAEANNKVDIYLR